MSGKRSFRLVRNLSLLHMYKKEGFAPGLPCSRNRVCYAVWTRSMLRLKASPWRGARQNDVLLYLVNFLEWAQDLFLFFKIEHLRCYAGGAGNMQEERKFYNKEKFTEVSTIINNNE